MGGVPGSMADGMCIVVDVGLLACIYWCRRSGRPSRVRSLLRFSSGGGGIDTISGEGHRRLLLLFVLSVENVDGVFCREQEVRLGFLSPQIIFGTYVFVDRRWFYGVFCSPFLCASNEMCSLLWAMPGMLCFLHVFFVVFGGGSAIWWWLLEG